MISTKYLRTLSALCLLLLLASCEKDVKESIIPADDQTDKEEEQTDKEEQMGDYFVSPSGSDSNTGTSPTTPFKTLSHAISMLKPGMVLNVLPGDYNLTRGSELVFTPSMSGEEEKYITVKAHNPNNPPRIIAGGDRFWNTLTIQASYIIIDGIEFQGYNQTFTQSDSLAAYNYAKASHNKTLQNINDAAIYCTNGISIGQKKDADPVPHHVIVRNCMIHDFPGGGLAASKADYVTFDNNVVYNNAWYSMYANSGVSVLGVIDIDKNITDYKIIVKNNTVYNNHTKIPWASTADFRYSDGNGIIMDVNDGKTQNTFSYQGRTLVANNVTYLNGGSGIHAFHARNIDILNNTAYHNAQRYQDEYGEIFSQSGENNRIMNNIMYARVNQRCNNFVKDGGAAYTNNIYFGGKYTQVAEDKYADPFFVKTPLNCEDKADFHLKQGSPAIGFGSKVVGVPTTDKDGVTRGNSVDAGAYQSH